jgi:hypothetical protein
VDIARAAQALAPRVAPSFLKSIELLKYSIFNRKYSILKDSDNSRLICGWPQNVVDQPLEETIPLSA